MINLQLILLLVLFAPAAGQSADQRFLAGLHERGLYRLAEVYCTDRLNRPDLSDEERAELAIALSRSLAQRAAESPEELRRPLWDQSQRIIDRFARQYPKNPRLPLVRLQGALGLLARGELARQEAELARNAKPLLDEAKTNLRRAVAELRRLADRVDQQLRRQNASHGNDPAVLSADRLVAIKKHIRYELAKAYRNQAQCYPADSADRANSLVQATELLGPLAGGDPADPTTWKSRIDLIACYRLLADYQTAAGMLEVVFRQELPPPLELRARAEQLRLALATGRLDDAAAVLARRRQIDGVGSAELDYARLEACLAAYRTAAEANDPAQAKLWQAKAMESAEQIERCYGPCLVQRAAMLLGREFRAAPATGNLDVLVSVAEGLYRIGKIDDALALYDKAVAQATRSGDAARAFKLGYTAAAIEHQRGRHERASDRYRRIAAAMPENPKAATAHLTAIYLARAKPQAASAKPQAALLEEHLRLWPAGPGAGKVRLQLGQLYERSRDWPRAIATYRDVPPDNATYRRAVEAVGRCYEAWLAALHSAGKPTAQIAAEAADRFESLLADRHGRLVEHWGPLQRYAALQAARLRMNYTSGGSARAEFLLQAIERLQRDGTQLTTSEQRGIKLLRAKTIARSGAADDALAAYRSLTEEYPRDGAIQEEYARLLSGRDDRQSLGAALERWRMVEKKSPPQSDRWFRAKYAIAILHYRLGNPQQTAKMITLLRLLHPELGGPAMKRKFEALLER